MTDQINLGLVWASAGGTEDPGDLKYEGGWISEIPTFQEFNFMLKSLDSNTLHFAESSMYDWQEDINYKPGARVFDVTTAKNYTCRAAHLNQPPTGDVSFSYWVEGWLVGTDFANLVQSEGFKVGLTPRTGTTYTGQDVTLVNNIPMLKLVTTATSKNWGIANVAGEICVVDMGNSTSPDGRDLARDGGNSHRLFHEGHFPHVSEVVDAMEEAPNDGKLYSRLNESWVVVTSTVVSDAPPPAVSGAGQGWYNLADGQFYLDINDSDSSQWVNANPPTIPRLAESVRSVMGSASRNVVMTPNPLNGLTATTVGMSSTLYAGNSSTQSIVTGVDMATGDLGGLVWLKSRTSTSDFNLYDTVRGVDRRLESNNADIEASNNNTLTSFNSTGFSVGNAIRLNNSNDTFVAWTWQTTKKVTGLTNRNKAYTAHYNPGLGFSIIGYQGDGVVGHEMPHLLVKKPELTMWKNRSSTASFVLRSSLFSDGDYLQLDSNDGITAGAANTNEAVFSKYTVSLNTSNSRNSLNDDYIAYNFTSIPGVCEINTYIGTESAGKYITCGFKVAWVLFKCLTDSKDWIIIDAARGNSVSLSPNNNATDITNLKLEFVDEGFVLTNPNGETNDLSEDYIFMAYAEGTAFDGTKTLTNYPRPTNGNEVTVTDGTVISYASGFDEDGEVNFNEDVVGDTVVTLPANSESKKLYMYKDQGSSYGFTEYKPLEVQDYFGVQSPLSFDDVNVRTTDKHFGYQSASGIASASGDTGGTEAWRAFDSEGDGSSYWRIQTSTLSSLQYKFVEPRILKSYRLKERLDSSTQLPRRFTVEGSNGESVWTVIDSTYASSDYVGNGVSLWGDIQDTSANTTAYVYYRINITANDANTYTTIAELEFNTISPSDRYDVAQGIMYNSAGSAINRTYVGRILTDSDGDVVQVDDVGVAKFKAINGEFHGDVTVHGNLNSKFALTAWAVVDMRASPHILLAGENVHSVADIGSGRTRITWDTPMDTDIYCVNTNGDSLVSIAYVQNMTKNYVDIMSYRDELNDYRDVVAYVQVSGGKKIL